MLDRIIHRLCSIISFFVAVLLWMSPEAQVAIEKASTSDILIRAGVGFVTMVGVLISFSLIPFQRVDQLSTFSISDYFLKSRNTQFILTFMFLFPLFTFIAAVDGIWLSKGAIFPIWVFGFGVGLDCLREYYYKVCYLIDPFKRVGYLEERGMKVIKQQDYEALGKKIIQASEATYQAIQNKNIVVSSHILSMIKHLACFFLDSVKKVNMGNGHSLRNEKIYEDNSILSSFCSHLEFIYSAAIEYKFEDSCNQIITSLAVISAYAMALKPGISPEKWTSFTLLPLNSIQYCLTIAQDHHLTNVINTSSGALKALLVELLKDIDKYPDIEEEAKYTINLMIQCSDEKISLMRTLPFLKDLKSSLEQSHYLQRDDLKAIAEYISEILPILES
ncbi:MAG: hypothetical protein ACI8RA_001340 [Chlamydiales bacterium]|jgi:hypothetical protein